MPMSPREVMRSAVRFQTPDRLPVLMDALGYSDFSCVSLRQDAPRHQTGVGPDEFGCVWAQTEVHNMGQVVGHPLKDLAQAADYPLPDPLDPAIYERVGAQIEAAEKEERYIQVDQFMILFERMHSLIGFAEVFEALMLNPGELGILADRIVAYDVAKINRCGELFGDRIHCFGGTDDWGTQISAFISPDQWRAFFLPRYKRIFDAAHAFDWDVSLHSCGKVNDLIPLFLEAGVSKVNLQQPRALGIPAISSRFRGKICFESLCDIQMTLPAGDAAAIGREAGELLATWANPAGGFILADYGDGEAIGVAHPTKKIMLKAFLEHDPFARASGVRHPAWRVLKADG